MGEKHLLELNIDDQVARCVDSIDIYVVYYNIYTTENYDTVQTLFEFKV